METLDKFWYGMAKEVNDRLVKQDDRMVKSYSRRKDIAKIDVRTVFKQGD